MKKLTSREIRKVFLEFFESKGHKVIESSSLIPADDPTLLFTTAGMVQFKPYFLREKEPPFTRATSVQKCLRAGGKASDLENVGKTPRHHTFFEMLGNFSFGDYFKREAIKFAWEFVTEVVEIDKSLLYVSIYKDDEEAFEIWTKEIGISPDRVVRLGEKDNFWGPPGDEGPCGPCSEIYIDLRDIWGYDKEKCKSLEDCDGFLEFWNLVFMQYYQDRYGNRKELEFKGIDTGMGLERLAMILQGKKSVYETDVFEPIIKKICEVTGKKYEGDNVVPMNVIADHTRAITFVGAEGVYPSNEGRGYVIRRILRRALRYSSKMGVNEPIVYKVIDGVVEGMGDVYPEIASKKDAIKKVIKVEEERYFDTVSKGIQYLTGVIEKLKDMKVNVLPGEEVFKLYDSMGVPIDLIEDICSDEGISIEWNKFNELMEEQKKRGKVSWKGADKLDFTAIVRDIKPTKYVGDEYHEYESTIVSLFKYGDGKIERVDTITEGELGLVIVEETPFYGEGGGQVGDIGMMISDENIAIITDTKKSNDVYVHFVKVDKGSFSIGKKVRLSVDYDRKMSIARHHTATHLLHAALRKVLGEHVVQSGSLVEPNRLRFDFSHYAALSEKDIEAIENEVNEVMLKNVEVVKRFMSKKEAISSGALAFFGDKYGDVVRVVEVPGFSKELCGGTHVNRTGDIGIFKVIDEESVASGVRRITAVAGKALLNYIREREKIISLLSAKLSVPSGDIVNRVEGLLNKLKELEKGKASRQVSKEEILSSLSEMNSIKVVFKVIDNADINQLGGVVDTVRAEITSVVVMLISKSDDRVSFVCGTNIDKIDLREVINRLSSLGVKGGGRKDFIRGGIAKDSDLERIKSKFVDIVTKG